MSTDADDDGPQVQKTMENEVRERISKAAQDLQSKYANGSQNTDNSVTAPTGTAYKEKHQQEQAIKNQQKQLKQQQQSSSSSSGQSSSLISEADDGDEDAGLRELRDARKKQLLNEHQEKIENIAKGHGQYREITQDEFLSEVTTSKYVICHFYHRDFPRCKVMDHHLNVLATRHVECKFIKINAEKALFFVEKLIIRSIPTVVLFEDGVGKDKIIGFEGLSDTLPEGKEDEWSTATLARLIVLKGNYIKKDLIVDTDAEQARKIHEMEEMKKKIARGLMENLDDDFNLLNDDND